MPKRSDNSPDKPYLSKDLWKQYAFPLVLLLTSLLLYSNTFSAEFTYDDLTVVTNNEIKYWHFWDLWQGWGRSTRTLSLMIDYHIFGDSPAGYHFQNILWHILSVLLLYFVFVKLSEDRLLSFFASLLFAVHPIHVEAIANIANRKEAICMVFSLISFMLYLRFIEEIDRRRWKWLVGSLFTWYLALNSKEVAAILPLTMVAYEVVFLPKEKRFLGKNPSLLFALLVVTSISFLFFSKEIISNLFSSGNIVTLGGYKGYLDMHSVTISSAKAFWNYMKLLFFPFNLSPVHVLELSHSLKEPLAMMSWISALILILLLFYLLRNNKLATFGTLWFLIHYIPVSNIIPSVYMVADRYMYIPSAGFCLLFVSSVKKLHSELLYRFDRRFVGRIMTVIICAVFAFYSMKTLTYNHAWLNSLRLWDYAIKVSPTSYKSYTNRGVVHHNSRRYQLALNDFNSALKIYPKHTNALINRGTTHTMLGEHHMAIKDYKAALKLKPDDVEIYFNLGISYESLDNYSSAIEAYNSVIKIKPQHKKAYYRRGNAFWNAGNRADAQRDYDKAAQLDGKSLSVYARRGMLHMDAGNYKQAVGDFTLAIEEDADSANAYYNRGLAHGSMGNLIQAIDDYAHAIKNNPFFAKAYSNRGAAYGQLRKYKEAQNDFEMSVRFNPKDGKAHFNLGIAYSKTGNLHKARIHLNKAADLGVKEAILQLKKIKP